MAAGPQMEIRATTVRLKMIAVKGILATCFTIMSFYVVVANWSDVDTDDMHMFKTLMYMLLVVLLTPQLYQARASLTFDQAPRAHPLPAPLDARPHRRPSSR